MSGIYGCEVTIIGASRAAGGDLHLDAIQHPADTEEREKTLLQFVKILKSIEYNGVVTLELFNQADLFESLSLFETLWMKV